jgi:hypothetical protein
MSGDKQRFILINMSGDKQRLILINSSTIRIIAIMRKVLTQASNIVISK